MTTHKMPDGNTAHDSLDREEAEIIDRLGRSAAVFAREQRRYQSVFDDATRRFAIIDEWRRRLLEGATD